MTVLNTIFHSHHRFLYGMTNVWISDTTMGNKYEWRRWLRDFFLSYGNKKNQIYRIRKFTIDNIIMYNIWNCSYENWIMLIIKCILTLWLLCLMIHTYFALDVWLSTVFILEYPNFCFQLVPTHGALLQSLHLPSQHFIALSSEPLSANFVQMLIFIFAQPILQDTYYHLIPCMRP